MGILSDKFIGQIFIEENVNDEIYLNQDNVIDHFITESLDNQFNQDRNLLLDEESL